MRRQLVPRDRRLPRVHGADGRRLSARRHGHRAGRVPGTGGRLARRAGRQGRRLALIGQTFTGPRYFHPRPSAAGDGYDAMASSASNLGPTNPELLDAVARARAAYRARERPRPGARAGRRGHGLRLRPRPAHLARERAAAGAARRARARPRRSTDVLALVDEHTDGRSLGFLGEPGVNVLELNLALDATGVAFAMARGDAPHLPRRRGRRRQDLRDAQRGPPPPRVRRGRRRRLRRDARREKTADAGRRPRGRAAAAGRVPRRRRFEELDVDARARAAGRRSRSSTSSRTRTCPGSRNEKRWQDVEELLEAGIDVISTLNIQHLESLNDVVEQITGVKQRETIPDEVVRRADEIQLVDLTPLALRNRLARGDVYPPERIDAALANYFRPGNLSALRELALAWLADRVDEGLADYRARHGIDGAVGDARARARRAHRLGGRRAARPPRRPRSRSARRATSSPCTWSRRTGSRRPRPRCSTAARARRGARRHVPRGRRRRHRRRAARGRALAERDADRDGREPPLALAAAHARLGDRQGDPRVGRRDRRPRRQPPGGALRGRLRRPAHAAALRRCRAAASVLGVAARRRRRCRSSRRCSRSCASTSGSRACCSSTCCSSSPSRRSAGCGRRSPRRSPASCSPTGTSRRRCTRSRSARARTSSRSSSSSPSPAIVSGFVSLAARRAAEGARARAEAEALARLAGALAGRGGRSTASAACSGSTAPPCSHRDDGGWRIEAASGERVPESPEAAPTTIDLDDEHVLALAGAPVRSEDQRVLDAFAKELAASVELGELEAEAEAAGALSAANELRAAHPLRRLPRPADAARRDQGLGDEPAPGRRRLDARGAARVPRRRSTRRPTGSTRSSGTCST